MSGFNYAGPGAKVGIQAGTVVITGGLVVDGDGIKAGDVTVTGSDDGEDGQ